jgi:hypothetical protein
MPNYMAYEEADQKPSLELGTGRGGWVERKVENSLGWMLFLKLTY